MFYRPHRSLLQALTVSLLLHAVILSSEVNLLSLSVDAPAPALSALIISVPGESPSGPVSAPEIGSSSLATRSPLTNTSRAIIPLLEGSSPAVAEPGEARVSGPAHDNAAPAATPPATPARAGALSVAPSVAPPVIGGEGVSADDIRHYRLSLAIAARRFKRYPALASQRGWEGTVELALDINGPVAVPEVVLIHSSGRSVLDEQALEMISQAARVTPLPDGLKARSFRVLLPVQFSLENDL